MSGGVGPPLQIPPNSDLTLGMVCVDKAVAGCTTWTMRADERFANPAGVVQGGFLAALCDSAMSAAALTATRGGPTPQSLATTDLSASFLAPVPLGTPLTCEAVVVGRGSRVAFVEATVRGPQGTLYVRARATVLYGPARPETGPVLAAREPSGEDGEQADPGRGPGRDEEQVGK